MHQKQPPAKIATPGSLSASWERAVRGCHGRDPHESCEHRESCHDASFPAGWNFSATPLMQ